MGGGHDAGEREKQACMQGVACRASQCQCQSLLQAVAASRKPRAVGAVLTLPLSPWGAQGGRWGPRPDIRDHGAWPMPAWRPRERNHPTRGLLCNCGPDSWPDSARRHVSWACPSRARPPTRGRDAGRCLPGAHAGGITQPAVGTLWAPALGPLPGGSSAWRAHHAPARPPWLPTSSS